MLQMKTNENRLVNLLTYSFSNSHSVVLRELLQNCRRAGATRIEVEHDPDAETLTVRDDGSGIGDFQKLLTLGESGWEPEVIARENAFGVGFLSGLCSASHIEVVSNGLCLAAATQDILEFRPVGLTPCENTKGTRITLRGVVVEDVLSRLRQIVKGFPIEVVINGEVLPRPHAIGGELDFIETPVGLIHVEGLVPGCDSANGFPSAAGSSHLTLYYQGLPVYSGYNVGNVVHLEQSLFHARLPDRDKLYDEDKAKSQVEETVARIWREHLETAKRNHSSGRDFVDRYYSTCRQWNSLDLLNDIDELPSAMFWVTDYPRLYWESDDNLSRYRQTVSRADIEQGRLRPCILPNLDEETIMAWMYAHLMDAVITDENALHQDHWIWPHVRHINNSDVAITVDKSLRNSVYNGSWIYSVDVCLCRGYTMTGPFGVVYCDDKPVSANGLVSLRADCPATDTQDLILVPRRGEKDAGDVVRQLSSFTNDDDHYDETGETEESDNFTRFVLSLEPRRAARVFRDILENASIGRYPGLVGKRFDVSIVKESRIKVRQLKNR